MKQLLKAVLLLGLTPILAIGGGFASSYRLNSGVVALTNDQANSSWAVVAALVKFDAATNGTVAVRRESQGNTYTLATCTFAAATNLIWAAEREYSFGYGDVLVIASTATNGVVQVMRKSE